MEIQTEQRDNGNRWRGMKMGKEYSAVKCNRMSQYSGCTPAALDMQIMRQWKRERLCR